MADPIHQFEIHKLFTIGKIGGQEIAFTNSSLYMVIAVLLIALLLIGATSGRSLVPGRMQSLAGARLTTQPARSQPASCRPNSLR